MLAGNLLFRLTFLRRQSPLGCGNVSRGTAVPCSFPGYLRVLRPSFMFQSATRLAIATNGPGLYEFTGDLERFVRAADIGAGLVTAFCRHTSASLLLQENADDSVKTDLTGFFRRLAPEGMEWIVHRTEGPDDMPAHIKAALTQSSVGIPVLDGAPVLGTWQGIYLFEHRARPHRREIVLHIIGEQ